MQFTKWYLSKNVRLIGSYKYPIKEDTLDWSSVKKAISIKHYTVLLSSIVLHKLYSFLPYSDKSYYITLQIKMGKKYGMKKKVQVDLRIVLVETVIVVHKNVSIMK